MENNKFSWVPGNLTTESIWTELADFYSKHYGFYSKNLTTEKQGKAIVLSAKSISKYLNTSSELYTVRERGGLIGYAIVQKGTTSKKNERIIWVTQFVVHNEHRNRGIGKELLFHIWGFSQYFAWGLLTANPYAIRALEKTTHRRCDPVSIKHNSVKLMNFGKKRVWYIDRETETVIDGVNSKINTKFPVDLAGLNEMLARTTDDSRPWTLQIIEEGWEWFAFTFKNQTPIELSKEEVERMLETSDSIVQEAYARMPMDDHKWAQYTTPEIDFIIENCKLSEANTIIDIGCGMGRHSIELVERRFSKVIGVDVIENLIEKAKKKSKEKNIEVAFKVGDIFLKDIPEFKKEYDCVLCLYDVVGSYASYDKNAQMLKIYLPC